jgi:RNA polymerase sigma-70 factor (ECF subfamily)
LNQQVAYKELSSAATTRGSVTKVSSNTGNRSHSTHKDLSDGEIIRLYLQTQRPDYFSVLYQRYATKVFGKCISILKDYDEAKDAVQDIFVKIMTNLINFGERAQFSTWVYSITYNYCIDIIRKKKKEKTLFTDDIERAPDVAEEEVPDEFLLEMEVKHLKAVLEDLPTGDRMILLMKYQDDMSIRDISEVLNKTESAVKMKIKRAKHKAQELFYKKFNRDT